MTQRQYYTRCLCLAGKLSTPGGAEFLVAHIHLPPRDQANDFPPPPHADMTRQDPGVPCQCLSERTRLPGRSDIIGVHFHREGDDIWWAGERTPDSQGSSINKGVLAGLAVTAILVGVGAGVFFFTPIAALPASAWAPAPGAVAASLQAVKALFGGNGVKALQSLYHLLLLDRLDSEPYSMATEKTVDGKFIKKKESTIENHLPVYLH
ncbi:hypothetical protein QBC45DRAFT_427453 [Copromyces sp. CBS 386.78]|nr:hypothetical protein QBC45DRAFT_427453 [Copromyces sp. CBS 386.78]